MAVFYDPGHAVGSCSLGPFPAAGRYVSLPPERFGHSAACGSYLTVQGPRGQVRAVSMRNGDVAWRHVTPNGKMAASPAVFGDEIVAHGMDGHV